MELRRYWQILMRYWLLILALTLVGLLAAYQYYTSNRPTYQAVAVVSIVNVPSPNDQYSGLYSSQNSEFVADELTSIVTGNFFMTAISTQLKEGQVNLSPDELKGMVAVERKHRELTITASSNDQNNALQVARTVARNLESSASDYVKPRQVVATVIDNPSGAALSGGRTVILAAVRVLAGLMAGVALAFLLAYLDTSIRTKAEAQEILDLPVLAVVPRNQTGQVQAALDGPGTGPTLPLPEQIDQKQVSSSSTR